MKNLEIEQIEEEDELNADISLGIGSKAAIKHLKMRNMKYTASIYRKPSTGLPRMEVSITKKQSMESDWISASESLLE